jgi:hypothetical protein
LGLRKCAKGKLLDRKKLWIAWRAVRLIPQLKGLAALELVSGE